MKRERQEERNKEREEKRERQEERNKEREEKRERQEERNKGGREREKKSNNKNKKQPMTTRHPIPETTLTQFKLNPPVFARGK